MEHTHGNSGVAIISINIVLWMSNGLIYVYIVGLCVKRIVMLHVTFAAINRNFPIIISYTIC